LEKNLSKTKAIAHVKYAKMVKNPWKPKAIAYEIC